MNFDSIANLTKAAAATGTVEVLATIPTPDQMDSVIKIVSQLLIVIATIFSLFRKKK